MDAATIEAVKIPTDRVDAKTGKVRVWDVAKQKHRDCYPVDAREMIAVGAVLLDKPEESPVPVAAAADPAASRGKRSTVSES